MSVSSEHGSRLAERATLGSALRDRVDDVIDRVNPLTFDEGGRFGETIEETFRAATRAATLVVANRIAHGDGEGARPSGTYSPGDGFADVARLRGASVAEVAVRCMRWRDCIASVLMDEAELLGVSRGAVREALWLTLQSFDATLLRMCGAYDVERQSLVDALSRRR